MTDAITLDLSKEFKSLEYSTYRKYKELYKFLTDAGAEFKFNYSNSGWYLPDSLTIDRETAVLIRLRFG